MHLIFYTVQRHPRKCKTRSGLRRFQSETSYKLKKIIFTYIFSIWFHRFIGSNFILGNLRRNLVVSQLQTSDFLNYIFICHHIFICLQTDKNVHAEFYTLCVPTFISMQIRLFLDVITTQTINK